jgi:hypothetical protein
MEDPTVSQSPWLRWYDDYPYIRAVLKTSESLPPEVQRTIGGHMLKVVKQFWREHKIQKNTDTLAPEFVNLVQKSRNKRRWYDAVPQMRMALNLFLMLPPKQRLKLDEKCASLVEHIINYRMGRDSLSAMKLSYLPKPSWKTRFRLR